VVDFISNWLIAKLAKAAQKVSAKLKKMGQKFGQKYGGKRSKYSQDNKFNKAEKVGKDSSFDYEGQLGDKDNLLEDREEKYNKFNKSGKVDKDRSIDLDKELEDKEKESAEERRKRRDKQGNDRADIDLDKDRDRRDRRDRNKLDKDNKDNKKKDKNKSIDEERDKSNKKDSNEEDKFNNKEKKDVSFKVNYPFSMYGQAHQLIGISNKSKFEILIASNPENLVSAIKNAIKELEMSNRPDSEKAQYKGILQQALNKANDVKYDVEMRKGQILSGIKKDPEAESEAIRQATMAGLASVARLLKLVAGDAKIKSLDDFYKEAPKERYIPTMKGHKSIGIFIRTELYERLGEGWPKVRERVVNEEKPELINGVKKVQQSGNLQHWARLKKRGFVESNADIKSYDPNRVEYHVDHIEPIVKHWNREGNNSGDDTRYNHMSNRSNLELVTAQYNTSKGGEGSNYDRFVKPGFTSYIAGGGIENSLVIKGKPFLDAAGNELK
ncbi:MAG: hypothetical protein ACFBSE_17510, partial [Prochloraceae cyanobacterium]